MAWSAVWCAPLPDNRAATPLFSRPGSAAPPVSALAIDRGGLNTLPSVRTVPPRPFCEAPEYASPWRCKEICSAADFH